MGTRSKPQAPDYNSLAFTDQAAKKASYDAAVKANRPNQVGPTGSLTWQQDPSGNWTQTTTMNPNEQRIMEAGQQNQLGVQGKIGEQLAGFDTGQIDFSGVPTMPEVGGYDQRSIDTIRALQAPQLERQRAAREAAMTAKGLGEGTGGAWTTGQQDLGDTENRADLNAILAGIQEGNVDFGQGMQAQGQAFGQAIAKPQANLAQLSGLMDLGQRAPNVRMPTFQSVNQVGMAPTADIMGAAQNQFGAERDAYNAETASRDKLLGGLMGLGGMAFGGPIGGAAAKGLANYFTDSGNSEPWASNSYRGY
jgi:hypothetical protein